MESFGFVRLRLLEPLDAIIRRSAAASDT